MGVVRRIKIRSAAEYQNKRKARPPLKKGGVPEGQGIDCLEEAEFCRMRTGKCGIDGRTSGTDGMLSAT